MSKSSRSVNSSESTKTKPNDAEGGDGQMVVGMAIAGRGIRGGNTGVHLGGRGVIINNMFLFCSPELCAP